MNFREHRTFRETFGQCDRVLHGMIDGSNGSPHNLDVWAYCPSNPIDHLAKNNKLIFVTEYKLTQKKGEQDHEFNVTN